MTSTYDDANIIRIVDQLKVQNRCAKILMICRATAIPLVGILRNDKNSAVNEEDVNIHNTLYQAR